MGFGGFDFSDAYHARRAGGGRRSTAETASNFQDIFSQWFGGGKQADASTAPPEKGADLEYGLSIDFWQAIQGTQVRLNISRQEACATCNGTGVEVRRERGLSGMQRQRQRDADGGRDAIQPDLPALRRNRTFAK